MFSHSGIRIPAAAVLLALLAACTGEDGRKDRTVPTRTLEQVTEIMDRHTDELIRTDGVVGVAIGALEDSTLCIQVLVRQRTEEIEKLIPGTIEGVPVVIEETGEIVPLGGE